jgi:hypothetical protein
MPRKSFGERQASLPPETELDYNSNLSRPGPLSGRF